VAERDPSRLGRSFVTPEGVDLRLALADGGQRFAAFMIDALLLIGALIAVTILLGLALAAFGARGIEYVAILWLLGFFFLRNCYFIAMELGQRAATIGKRVIGIRVAARSGGRLTADAVVARNLMRELEIFLPLSFLGYQADQGLGDALTTLIGFLWAAIFAFFPLFNRDRLRAGDLIAGTWVVRAPRKVLGRNLVAEADRYGHGPAFSDEQLNIYGVLELQTLEQVLRNSDGSAMATVAATIRAKIGWDGIESDAEFLHAYYSALRTRLERNLLFGRRRADKFDRG